MRRRQPRPAPVVVAAPVVEAQANPGAPVDTPAETPKPIECPECGKTFKNIAGLRSHTRHAHVNTGSAD